MARTSPLITFGLFALDVKLSASFAMSDEQTFSKADDLKTGNVVPLPLITYEPDYWLLSGQYKIKPVADADVRAGVISLSQSDDTGAFTVPPVMTITLSTPQTADSLNLRFSQASGDWADDIDIDYYNVFDVLIRSDSYAPAAWQFSTNQAVSNFSKIVITFNSTNNPYRYLRITGIDFGTLVTFTSGDIKSASVVEQANPLSTELPIGALDLQLYSTDATFSIINPTGDYAALEERQPLDVYESVNGSQFYIGQYFLETWENPSNAQIIFRAIDAIGILDQIPHPGGIWTSAVTVADLVADIMETANIPYDLDPSLAAEELTGWIPFTNCREALQQVAFAAGAMVTSNRSSLVKIYPVTLAADATDYAGNIDKSQKGVGQRLSQRPLVTGVSVTAHKYIANSDTRTLYNAELAPGEYTVKFSEPAHTLSISGASIIASGANFATILVQTTGTVLLTGRGYDDTIQIGITQGIYPGNVRKKVIEITDATMVSPDNVTTVSNRVYNYYQQRYKQEAKLFANLNSAGETVEVETLYDRWLGGTIEKMTIDLSGGFASRAEIIGVIQDA